MMWKTVKSGDTRMRVKFAWLPEDCVDGMTRWLEWVTAEEDFVICSVFVGWRTMRVFPVDSKRRTT